LEAARKAHEKLKTQLDQESEQNKKNLSDSTGTIDRASKLEQDYNTANSQRRNALSLKDDAAYNRAVQDKIAKGMKPENAEKEARRELDLQEKNREYNTAREEAANARIEKDAFDKKYALQKEYYDKEVAAKVDAETKAANILAQNDFSAVPANVESVLMAATRSNGFSFPLNVGSAIGKNLSEIDKANLENTFRQEAYKQYIQQKTRAASATENISGLTSSGFDPTGKSKDTIATQTANKQTAAETSNINLEATKVKNDNDAKAEILENNKTFVDGFVDSWQKYFQWLLDTAKAAQDAAKQKWSDDMKKKGVALTGEKNKADEDLKAATKALADEVPTAKQRAKGLITPGYINPTSLGGNADLAMQAYLSPKLREQRKRDERTQDRVEKRLRHDAKSGFEKLAKTAAGKLSGKPTGAERAAMDVIGARRAETTATDNYNKAADAVIDIQKKWDKYITESTMGGN
jgi:hypothetical protein